MDGQISNRAGLAFRSNEKVDLTLVESLRSLDRKDWQGTAGSGCSLGDEKVKGGNRSMWLFGKKGFVAISSVQDDPELFWVYGRLPGHIQALLGSEVKVEESVLDDYRFRTLVSRARVAEAVAAQLMDIDYANLDEELEEGDSYREACLQIAVILRGAQNRLLYHMGIRRKISRGPKPAGPGMTVSDGNMRRLGKKSVQQQNLFKED